MPGAPCRFVPGGRRALPFALPVAGLGRRWGVRCDPAVGFFTQATRPHVRVAGTQSKCVLGIQNASWGASVERFRGAKAGQFAPVSTTLTAANAKRFKRMVKEIVASSGIAPWQARSAVIATCIRTTLGRSQLPA